MLMALFAVPRGVYRVLVWLAMTVVAWLMAAVETAYAEVSWSWNSTIGRLDISSNSIGDSIELTTQNDCVLLNSSILFHNGSTPIAPADVASVSVSAGGGNDTVDMRAVTYTGGFTQFPQITINGGAGDDILRGGDDPVTGIADDVLIGGPGADSLYGYAGYDDLFAYTNDPGDEFDSDGSQDWLWGNSPFVAQESGDDLHWNDTPDNDQENEDPS